MIKKFLKEFKIKRKAKKLMKENWTICFNKYKDDGKYFVVYIKELPGCISQGKSIKEAYLNIKKALQLYLEASLDLNLKINLPKKDD